MSPDELIRTAEQRLRDAESNLVSCVAALNEAKRLHGSVPNTEVLALVQVQAVTSQACAMLALAKVGCDLAAPAVEVTSDAPESAEVV